MLRARQRFETPYRSVDPYERVTYSFAMQFVQFGVLSECGLPCGHGPEMMRARWLDLTWVMHFCIDICHANELSNSSQFSHFCCLSPLASTVVGLSGFPPSCPLRSSLFHASLRCAPRLRWCSLTHGFLLRLKKGYHLAVSVCWNQSSTKNRANGT